MAAGEPTLPATRCRRRGRASGAASSGGPHLQLRLRGRCSRSALLIANIATERGGFGLTNQLANVAPLAIAALASAPSIIGGGFDLSISPLIFLTQQRVRRLARSRRPRRRRLGPDHARASGCAVGVLNGAADRRSLRVQPIVVTLAMYFILQGVDLRPRAATRRR